MIRRILTSVLVFSLLIIGSIAMAPDANAGDRGYYGHRSHGGISVGKAVAIGGALILLDAILNQNRPRVTYGYPTQAPVIIYRTQPQIIVVPGNVGHGGHLGNTGYGDYRARVIRSVADQQAWHEAEQQCRIHGRLSPFCGNR